MVKDSPLLQVKTLTKRMVGQIQVAHWPDAAAKAIFRGLQEGTIQPIAWLDGSVLDGFNAHVYVWLVKYNNNLFLIDAPSRGIDWVSKLWVGLEQIFIN